MAFGVWALGGVGCGHLAAELGTEWLSGSNKGRPGPAASRLTLAARTVSLPFGKHDCRHAPGLPYTAMIGVCHADSTVAALWCIAALLAGFQHSSPFLCPQIALFFLLLLVYALWPSLAHAYGEMYRPGGGRVVWSPQKAWPARCLPALWVASSSWHSLIQLDFVGQMSLSELAAFMAPQAMPVPLPMPCRGVPCGGTGVQVSSCTTRLGGSQ